MDLSRSIIQGMMGAYCQMGVEIIKFDEDTLTLYISIPKDSDDYYSGKNINSPQSFAKRIKETWSEMTKMKINVMYKIRDEFWTKDMGEKNYQICKDDIVNI